MKLTASGCTGAAQGRYFTRTRVRSNLPPRRRRKSQPLATKAAKPPEARLERFIDRYSPEVQAVARASLRRMRLLARGAVELVYDNYNALVIGFGPTERASDAIVSLALYPRWVNLSFLRGADLPDPEGLLRGGGTRVRGITLHRAERLDAPAIRALLRRALQRSPTPLDGSAARRTVIKSISAKQRPRRP